MGQYDTVDLVRSLSIGEAEKEKILGGNARRLLSIA
jgi:predicted TIM-barrel fold metal-dependent hydrolase